MTDAELNKLRKKLWSFVPHASADTIALNSNPLSSPQKKNKTSLRANLGAGKGKRGVMNKTESEFGLMLEAQKRAGEILRYEFEGITLRWADMRYTPDFVIFQGTDAQGLLPLKLIEVKGGHMWDRDIVRFKGARAYWPEFSFEMWQKTKLGWKQKY